MQAAGRGRGRRLLYWFRTPPGVRVGRAPIDEVAIRLLEQHNPDVEFDWTRILKAPPAADPPARRDSRDGRDRDQRGRREARPGQRPRSGGGSPAMPPPPRPYAVAERAAAQPATSADAPRHGMEDGESTIQAAGNSDHAEDQRAAEYADHAEDQRAAEYADHAEVGKAAEYADHAEVGKAAEYADHAESDKAAEYADHTETGRPAEYADHAATDQAAAFADQAAQGSVVAEPGDGEAIRLEPGGAYEDAPELDDARPADAGSASYVRLGAEGLVRLRARYAEVLARIAERPLDETAREELKLRAERLNPDAWVTADEVSAALEQYETVFEGLRGVIGRHPRRRPRGGR